MTYHDALDRTKRTSSTSTRMKLPPQLIKFAIFLIAVTCTFGLFYLAYLGMLWLYVYMGSFGLHAPSPNLRVVGGGFLAAIVVLRMYMRWRSKRAKPKKKPAESSQTIR